MKRMNEDDEDEDDEDDEDDDEDDEDKDAMVKDEELMKNNNIYIDIYALHMQPVEVYQAHWIKTHTSELPGYKLCSMIPWIRP
jgi:hypothetical protein